MRFRGLFVCVLMIAVAVSCKSGTGDETEAAGKPVAKEPASSSGVSDLVITTSGGEAFRSVVGYREDTFTPHGVDHVASGQAAKPSKSCWLLALRVRDDKLEETRDTKCRPGGLEEVDLEALTFVALPAARRKHLTEVLEGADPKPGGAPLSRVPDTPHVTRHVRVRLETSQAVYEGVVTAVKEPPAVEEVAAPAGATPAKAAGHSPRGLSQVWEAVNYPERYRQPS